MDNSKSEPKHVYLYICFGPLFEVAIRGSQEEGYRGHRRRAAQSDAERRRAAQSDAERRRATQSDAERRSLLDGRNIVEGRLKPTP